MRLISRHILRALSAPFFWGVLALTGLLLLNQLAVLIDRFGGRGLGFEVMIEAIVLALPALLTLTLPMSVLVATLYAYSRLAADLEMVAMYANGLSVWRMVRPALLAATVVAAINFLVFDQVVPLSNTRFRTLSSDVFRKTPTLSLRAQQLNELGNTGYLIWARSIDPIDGRLEEVTIWDLRSVNTRRVVHADSGLMAQAANGRDLLMTLFTGEQLDFTTPNPARIERTAFQVNRVRIADVSVEFERRSGQVARGDRERNGCELLDGISEREWIIQDRMRHRRHLTRRDLRLLVAATPLPAPPLQARPDLAGDCNPWWRRVGELFADLLLPTPLEAQEPVRRDTLTPAQDSLAAQDSAKQAAKAIDSSQGRSRIVAGRGGRPRQDGDSLSGQDSLAVAGVTQTADSATGQGEPTDAPAALPLDSPESDPMEFLVDPSQLDAPPPRDNGMVATLGEVFGARAEIEQAERTAREYRVEYHKKFAFPIASFCFVLVGIALALKFPRSGIGLVIGGSLIIFLIFYVMLIGGENIADKGVVSPQVAMYGPVVLFGVLGLGAVALANREMGTARSSGVLEWLLDTIRRIGRTR
jgi:lipopolysaccharide export LptBFGC system permease protein LptF